MKRSIALVSLLTFAAMPAFAATCETTVESNDQMQFNKKEIQIPKSCKVFKLTLAHTGKLAKNAMGHNIVITETSAVQAVSNDGISAGLNSDYIKPGDPRVIAATKLIGGGERSTVEVDVSKLKAGTPYTFFCSFPGHPSLMKGNVSLVD